MAGSGAAGDRDDAPAGFATGGLSGLMRGLRAMGESREDIDDLEALRRAEAAVAGVKGATGAAGGGPIDGSWSRIATHDGPGGLIGLQDVARALESEDVTVGWDPYDPSREVAFLPPGQSPRVYSLQVPAAQMDRARAVLEGATPDGVTYAWDAPTKAQGAPAPEAEFATDFGVDGVEPPSTPRAADPRLSDNERLQRMASGRGSGIGAAIALVFAVVAIAIALGWLLGR